jgi:hypothetical protein
MCVKYIIILRYQNPENKGLVRADLRFQAPPLPRPDCLILQAVRKVRCHTCRLWKRCRAIYRMQVGVGKVSFAHDHQTPGGESGRTVLILVGIVELAFASLFARLLARFPSLSLWSLKDGRCHLLKVLQSLRLICVFGFLYMDYVTRQFINLAEEFRKDLRAFVARLNSALDKQSEAIRECAQSSKSQQGPAPEITVLTNIPKSIEIHQNEKDATEDRQHKHRTTFLSFVSLCALVFYATLVYIQLRTMIDATSATEQAVKEARLTRQQTEKTLDATVEQFHLDQRAWVGPVEAAPPQFEVGGGRVYIKSGEGPRFSFVVSNTGKTPALHYQIEVASHVYQDSEKFVPDYPKPITKPTVGVLLPGVKAGVETSPSEGKATDWHVNELRSGRSIFYVYGRIDYQDVFHDIHKTTFCVFVTKDLTQLRSCGFYNYAD